MKHYVDAMITLVKCNDTWDLILQYVKDLVALLVFIMFFFSVVYRFFKGNNDYLDVAVVKGTQVHFVRHKYHRALYKVFAYILYNF